ncbi:putative ubiquinone biosynthesis monooxygenase [Coelomomyces lativittatus]|nr:putative ubiquinone biosynthesis monooxygenase [Coelomomyces lativittatus]
MKVYDATINAKVEFHADDYKFSSLGWIVDVPTLKSTLLESLRSSPVRLFPQTELYSLTYPSSSDSSTSCHFLPELHLNPNQSMQASLIIGADGIHSKVRQLSSISTFGHSYHQMGLVATLHVDTMANTTAWQRFLPTGPLALLPISDHEASLVWTLPQHHAKKILTLPSDQFIALLNAALTYPLEEVHIMLENSLNLNLVEEVAWRDSVYEQQPGFDFSQFPPQILDLVKDSRAAFPLSIRHVDQYTGERTVLVGDAAHVTHPLAGQGFNLGLADVTSLTRALDTAAGVGQDLGDPDVLGEYTRDRYFRNTLMLSLCDTLLNIFGVSSSPFVWLRKWGIHQFQSSHTLKALAIQCVSNWDGRLTKTQHRGIS